MGDTVYFRCLKFFERVRTEWLRSMAPAQGALRRTGQGMFVLSQTRMRYLRPARLPAEVLAMLPVYTDTAQS